MLKYICILFICCMGVINISQQQDNFKRGTAEMLILHLLQNEDLYGYQIVKTFKEKSNGTYILSEATLYLVLYRLLKSGYISDYEKTVGLRRKRRYYHIEQKGQLYYKNVLEDYLAITESISKILTLECAENVN